MEDSGMHPCSEIRGNFLTIFGRVRTYDKYLWNAYAKDSIQPRLHQVTVTSRSGVRCLVIGQWAALYFYSSFTVRAFGGHAGHICCRPVKIPVKKLDCIFRAEFWKLLVPWKTMSD